MPTLPLPGGGISPARYAVAAPALLVSQHLAVALAFAGAREPLLPDAGFWFLPLRHLAALPKRCRPSGQGYALAAFAIVPGLQAVAVLALTVLPARPASQALEPEVGSHVPYVLQGLLAGVAIIVLAVVVSAVLLGA